MQINKFLYIIISFPKLFMIKTTYKDTIFVSENL
jgi:hypothetical protein